MAELAGAAMRRQQRQLRSFLRHEELSVKMALARALHHSAPRVEVPREGEVHEKHHGLRAQKRPLSGASGRAVGWGSHGRLRGCRGSRTLFLTQWTRARQRTSSRPLCGRKRRRRKR